MAGGWSGLSDAKDRTGRAMNRYPITSTRWPPQPLVGPGRTVADLYVPRIKRRDHLRRLPVNLGLPFQVLREPASAGEDHSLLGLCLVPVAGSQQSSVPSSLELIR